jgi:hypothetical protein
VEAVALVAGAFLFAITAAGLGETALQTRQRDLLLLAAVTPAQYVDLPIAACGLADNLQPAVAESVHYCCAS